MLIAAVVDSGFRALETVSNDCGVDDVVLSFLLQHKRINWNTSSYVGKNGNSPASSCVGCGSRLSIRRPVLALQSPMAGFHATKTHRRA